MNESKENWLFKTIESNKEIRAKWLKAFDEGSSQQIIQRGAGINWYYHEREALKSFFIDKNLEQSKQHFYTCGRLDEFLITKYDEKILDYGINHLSYALLSDNISLIRRYADLYSSNYEKSINAGVATSTYILQCLIKDDWTGYERAMPIMKSKTVEKFGMKMDVAYFEALAERNKNKIEEVLAEFVTKKVHNQRNKANDLINKFISHPAIGYAKLAWLKGLEVNIMNPLIPETLLPIKPNKEYNDDYVFLTE